MYRLVCFFLLVARLNAIPIPNGVEGDAEVECGSAAININFNTQAEFEGRVFVKGLYNDEGCRSESQGGRTGSITLPFDTCNVQRVRSLEPRGVFISTVVVISFHPKFITKVDRALRIQCFYMEADKTVSQDLEVSPLTTGLQTQNVPMPVCRYDILDGGPDGPPVKYVLVGQAVYHKWVCDTDTIDTFCMVVHSCFVSDGAEDRADLLNGDGCALDKYLLRNLEYTADLMAGQETHVFKYADRPTLFFQCQIAITIKEPGQECARPTCAPLSFRAKRSPRHDLGTVDVVAQIDALELEDARDVAPEQNLLPHRVPIREVGCEVVFLPHMHPLSFRAKRSPRHDLGTVDVVAQIDALELEDARDVAPEQNLLPHRVPIREVGCGVVVLPHMHPLSFRAKRSPRHDLGTVDVVAQIDALELEDARDVAPEQNLLPHRVPIREVGCEVVFLPHMHPLSFRAKRSPRHDLGTVDVVAQIDALELEDARDVAPEQNLLPHRVPIREVGCGVVVLPHMHPLSFRAKRSPRHDLGTVDVVAQIDALELEDARDVAPEQNLLPHRVPIREVGCEVVFLPHMHPLSFRAKRSPRHDLGTVDVVAQIDALELEDARDVAPEQNLLPHRVPIREVGCEVVFLPHMHPLSFRAKRSPRHDLGTVDVVAQIDALELEDARDVAPEQNLLPHRVPIREVGCEVVFLPHMHPLSFRAKRSPRHDLGTVDVVAQIDALELEDARDVAPEQNLLPHRVPIREVGCGVVVLPHMHPLSFRAKRSPRHDLGTVDVVAQIDALELEDARDVAPEQNLLPHRVPIREVGCGVVVLPHMHPLSFRAKRSPRHDLGTVDVVAQIDALELEDARDVAPEQNLLPHRVPIREVGCEVVFLPHMHPLSFRAKRSPRHDLGTVDVVAQIDALELEDARDVAPEQNLLPHRVPIREVGCEVVFLPHMHPLSFRAKRSPRHDLGTVDVVAQIDALELEDARDVAPEQNLLPHRVPIREVGCGVVVLPHMHPLSFRAKRSPRHDLGTVDVVAQIDALELEDARDVAPEQNLLPHRVPIREVGCGVVVLPHMHPLSFRAKRSPRHDLGTVDVVAQIDALELEDARDVAPEQNLLPHRVPIREVGCGVVVLPHMHPLSFRAKRSPRHDLGTVDVVAQIDALELEDARDVAPEQNLLPHRVPIRELYNSDSGVCLSTTGFGALLAVLIGVTITAILSATLLLTRRSK